MHRGLEPRAVLGGVDRLDARADQLDAEPVEHAGLVELDREVERGLAAERRQQRVGSLALDDRAQARDVERLDVGRVGELGVGHDRRRVRVHEDDAVALGLEHPARLGARVVELAGLADDDRPAADDEDRLEVGRGAASVRRSRVRHAGQAVEPRPAIRSVNSSNRYAASCGPGPASGWCCTLNAATLADPQALDGPVVEVDVGDVGAAGHGVGLHDVVVVLAGDLDPAGRLVADRVVRTVMAEAGAWSSAAPSARPMIW